MRNFTVALKERNRGLEKLFISNIDIGEFKKSIGINKIRYWVMSHSPIRTKKRMHLTLKPEVNLFYSMKNRRQTKQ